MSSRDTVAQVKESYDIEDLVESYGISLKSSGVGKYKGLCPFHQEKTPSFTVDVQFQNYRCFGCGASGDVLSFVSEMDNLSFKEALTLLANGKGIEIEDSPGDSVDYQGLRAVTKSAASYFIKKISKLPHDHEAIEQIKSRGISGKDALFGYAPEGRTSLYKYLSEEKGYSDDLILQTGVCKKNSKTGEIFDFWSYRLMFVTTDIQGRPIAFTGRKLRESDKMGKYVNSSDSPIFSKSKVLYNLNSAKNPARDNGLYVCEGQFDVASFVHAGIDNVVASSGTAFTEDQADTCLRVSNGNRVVFCFDGDSAGIAATKKLMNLTPRLHSKADVVLFPEGMDPCDYRLENGDDGLREFVENNRVSLVEFVLEQLKEEFNLSSVVGRSEYLEEACNILTSVTNRSIVESALTIVSLNAAISYDSAQESLKEAKKGSKKRPKRKAEEEKDHSAPDELVDPTAEEEEILELFEVDRRFRICGQLMALGSRSNTIRKQVLDLEDEFPEELRPLLKELKRMGKKVVLEDLSMPRVAKKIYVEGDTDYVEFMTDKQVLRHTDDLISILVKDNCKEQKRNQTRTILSALSNENATVKDLERVLDSLTVTKQSR